MSLKEKLFDFLIMHLNEEEKANIQEYLERNKGSTSLTEDDLPSCYPFYLEGVEPCLSDCIIRRVCEKCRNELLISYLKELFGTSVKFEHIFWREVIGIEKPGEYKIKLSERLNLEGVTAIGDDNNEARNVEKIGEGKEERIEERRGPTLGNGIRPLSERESRGSRKGKELVLGKFRPSSKVGKAVTLFLEGKTIEEVAEVLNPNDPKEGFNYIHKNVFYLLRKNGFEVEILENRTVKIN